MKQVERQTNAHNEMRFKEGHLRRCELLSKVPDKFTPSQAAEAWSMKIMNVNAMTQKMKRYNLIVPNEGFRPRVFTKVKENIHGN